MKNSIKLYFTSLVLFVLFDLVWLGLLMGNFYTTEFGTLARRLPSGALDFNFPAAAVTYLLLALGVVVFILARTSGKSLGKIFLFGAVFGLITYGIYDFTNLATLAGWSTRLMTADVLWGMFQVGGVSTITALLGRNFRWL